MDAIHASANDPARSFRLTPRGRLRAQAPAQSPAHGHLSGHLHDLLQMCAAGMALRQMGQFMPPRTLRESLQTLLALGLVEEDSPTVPAALLAAA